MGKALLLLSIIFSLSAYGEFKPPANLRFKVGALEVNGLACLQDKERPVGSKVWGPRLSSHFSFVVITKPSYLMPNDLMLQAYVGSGLGRSQIAMTYDSTLTMKNLGESLELLDKIEPGRWTIHFSATAPLGTDDPLVSIKGVHLDLEQGVEYELVCSF